MEMKTNRCISFLSDCPLSSEECSHNQRKCKDGSCIRMDWMCDGYADCVDASDEDPEECSKL